MKTPRSQSSKRTSPSLEWIHRVRSEQKKARRGRQAQPLPRKEAEKLARRYGLKLARRVTPSRS